MRSSCSTLALLASLAISVAAHADTTDNFTIVSLDGTQNLSFTVASSPTPDSTSPGESFTLTGVPVIYNNVAMTDDIGFYNSDYLGGFADNFFNDPFSDVLFNDDVDNPTFLPGVYGFTDSVGGPVAGYVTITAGDAPNPLPWCFSEPAY